MHTVFCFDVYVMIIYLVMYIKYCTHILGIIWIAAFKHTLKGLSWSYLLLAINNQLLPL